MRSAWGWGATAVSFRHRIGQPTPLKAALLIAVMHGAFLLAVGVMQGQDTSGYNRWADQLVTSGFDYSAANALAGARRDFPPQFYTLFVTLIALLKLCLGAQWKLGLVALNLAADVATGTLLVGIARRATSSSVAGWTALALYVGCYDSVHWMPFLLSDMTFALITFTIFALVVRRILGEPTRWRWVLALAAVGVFYRPTGIVLLPDLGWAAWLARRRGAGVSRRVGSGIAVTMIAAASAFAAIAQDPSRWPFTAFRHSFDVVAKGYASGEVVSARLETYHAAPSSIGDFMLISLDRFIHFFAPGAAAFSGPHWWFQLCFFVPCYTLLVLFLVALATHRTGLEDRQRSVFIAALGALVAYAYFHGLVQVDYDWRYRLPALPYLILLAAGGAAVLARVSSADLKAVQFRRKDLRRERPDLAS